MILDGNHLAGPDCVARLAEFRDDIGHLPS